MMRGKLSNSRQGESGVKQAEKQSALPKNLRLVFRRIGDQLEAYYHGPYRSTLARAERDEEDLFMLLIYAESLGIPNPVSFYTLELQPQMLARFHQWHQRMGMERSPLDDMRCC